MSSKRRTMYDDEEYWSAFIIGTGAYQSIPCPAGKTKQKHPIGFIRPAQKRRERQPQQRTRKK